MKRYSFRLESVLRVRRIQEDLARADVLRGRTELDDAVRAADAAAEHGRAVAAEPLPTVPAVLAAEHRSRMWAQQAAADRRADADAAFVRLQDAIGRWSAAAQRMEAVERLDGRHRERHAVDALRAEAAVVDDIVSSAAARSER